MGKVGIIGLGLIGGSLGLALRRARLQDTVVIGFDRDEAVAARAQRYGAVAKVARSPEELAAESTIVVIATPIISVEKVLSTIASRLQKGAVVTDTASTKGSVMKWARDILPAGVHFVGGHPMAGKEASGPQAAEETLFDGRPYVIVPSVDAGPGAVNAIIGLVEAVGAKPLFLDAEEHDAYAAAISHVPLVASIALFSLARGSTAWPELAGMAGPAFQDLTRLASGSPEMSHDICLTNKTSIGHWLERYIAELRRLQVLIEGEDEQLLFRALAEAQIEHDNFIHSPPVREDAGPAPVDLPTPQQSFMNLMAGQAWAERAKEMTSGIEERARQRNREEQLRRNYE